MKTTLAKSILLFSLLAPLLAEAQNADRVRLRDAVDSALKTEADAERNLSEVANQYLDSISDNPEKADLNTLRFLKGRIDSTRDRMFRFCLENAAKLDSLAGNDKFFVVGGRLSEVIYREEVAPFMEGRGFDWNRIAANLRSKYPAIAEKLVQFQARRVRMKVLEEIKTPLYAEGAGTADWGKIEDGLKAKYPGFDYRPALLEAKTFYFANREMWPQSAEAADALMQQCGEQFIDHNYLDKDINDIVYTCVFGHCDDKRILAEAADWMRQLLVKERSRASVDTYANLLYKLGNTKEAIEQEKDALAAAQRLSAANPNSKGAREDVSDFTDKLQKMEAGKPTWE
jgi:hypothetical protein